MITGTPCRSRTDHQYMARSHPDPEQGTQAGYPAANSVATEATIGAARLISSGSLARGMRMKDRPLLGACQKKFQPGRMWMLRRRSAAHNSSPLTPASIRIQATVTVG